MPMSRLWEFLGSSWDVLLDTNTEPWELLHHQYLIISVGGFPLWRKQDWGIIYSIVSLKKLIAGPKLDKRGEVLPHKK